MATTTTARNKNMGNISRRRRSVPRLFLMTFLVGLDIVNSFSRHAAHTAPRRLSSQNSFSSLRKTRDSMKPLCRFQLPPHLSISEDPLFDGRTTVNLIGGQSLLIGAAAVAALILQTPNWGLGPGFQLVGDSVAQGAIYSLPLFAVAAALDTIEDKYPALQDVTMATQRSVVALLGATFKPILALGTSIVLGLAAGFGEEMLFRGVLQYELASRFGDFVAVGVSSIIFGALHAVTPLYALLATLASVFFGTLYTMSDNLAVPITTHTLYDVGALLWAHWTVCQLSDGERDEILNWKGPKG